jgi:aminopeptidase-like protein
VYLSRHAETMRQRTRAGFVVTCVGDDRTYSYLPSRNGNTLADRASLHVLRRYLDAFRSYSFLDRGSDERQYCSPGIDLPVCSVMRSKYAEYPEYHTSLDDLSLISPQGLDGAYQILRKVLQVLESNQTYRAVTPCEPQLGRRNLYPGLSIKTQGYDATRLMLNLLAYADGERDLIDISEIIDADYFAVAEVARTLLSHDLIAPVAGEKPHAA